MKNRTSFILATAALGFSLCVSSLSSYAQNQPQRVLEKKAPGQTNQVEAKTKQPVAGPFNGKLAGVDKVAKTITVGKRTFQLTSETKLRKANQPASLDDAVVGEKCSGYVKPTEDGKWIATTVNFGPKLESNGNGQKRAPTKTPRRN